MIAGDKVYDLNTERNVLKNLIQDKIFLENAVVNNLFVAEHFTDLFHVDCFNAVIDYYKKYLVTPTLERFKTHLTKFITYNTAKYPQKDKQRLIWIKSSERMFQKILDIDLESRDVDVSNLEEMRKARLLQYTQITVNLMYEDGEFEKAFNIMGEALSKFRHTENVVNEGDIVQDFDQHKDIQAMKQAGAIKPIRTGIKGAYEYDREDENNWKVLQLDDLLNGGWYSGELTIVVGENNVGKSFFLMESALQAAQRNKTNVLFPTIEMNKIKQQNRIYSRITGIPYRKFRMGELDKRDWERWEQAVHQWKKHCGVVYVVSFDKGASVLDIETKLKEVEQKYGEKFGLCCIDYLNDMKPENKNIDPKSWNAMGDISWGLHMLTIHYDHGRGISIITANQKKSDSAGKSFTDWNDAAYGTIVTQHCSLGIGMAQNDYDKRNKRIRVDLWKNRDGEKGASFYLYPKFQISQLHNMEMCKIFYKSRNIQGVKDGREEMEATNSGNKR